MSPPSVDEFLAGISRIVQGNDGQQLQNYLLIEPPLPPIYDQLISELRHAYPSASSNQALEDKCRSFIPEYDESENGGSRLSFISLMVKYFAFLRDLNIQNPIETHDLLKGLLNQFIVVLGSFLGLTVLPTAILLSQKLAKLAIYLDKRPELPAHLIQKESVGQDDAIERVTLVESSANVVREVFKKCLGERGGGPSGVDSNGRPEGRRIGIYLTANICLKLFFRCKKLRSAETIFSNIYQHSPPLALFPAPQRVTYLYYLGRYHFANNHFFRAQLALQEAFNQCSKGYASQRRQILIYLITSNIILGRFPKPTIWQLQEAALLQEKFEPICKAIKYGDLSSFRQLLDINSSHADWFIHKKILLQMSNRCEVLVWRSLARRTFLLSGSTGDASKNISPVLGLQDVLTLAIYLERKAKTLKNVPPSRAKHTNSISIENDDSDRDTESDYVDPDLAGVAGPTFELPPDMESIESIAASLVEQDLLHGYLAHSSHRFAIKGARTAPALQAGFPKVWDVIKGKADTEIPGWKKEERKGTLGGAPGPGSVIHLSGARPVGASA